MTSNESTQPRWLSRSMAVGVGIGCAGLLWFCLRLYANPGTAECRELYRSARTASDSAVIDRMIPPSSVQSSEPRDCRFERRRGGW